VVIMALNNMIIPPSNTIHQENDVRLAKFCSHSLEIYQVTGMAMTTAGLSLILNPEEPSSDYCFSLEDDPEGEPNPEAKAICILDTCAHITLHCSECVDRSHPGIQ
jgi:hypothetical protein